MSTISNLLRPLFRHSPPPPPSNPSLPIPLLKTYHKLLTTKKLLPNNSQQHLATKLTSLQQQLHHHLHTTPNNTSLLSRYVGWDSGVTSTTTRGVYVWGGVGSGKSMMLDLLFDSLENDGCEYGGDSSKKLRVHFHEFIDGYHRRLHESRRRNMGVDTADIVRRVTREMSREVRVLYVDELMVTDIGDAVVCKGLFEGLFKGGTVLLASSNRRPDDLYCGGVGRERFVPLIGRIYERCDVVEMGGGDCRDFRLRFGGEGKGWFLWGEDGERRLKRVFKGLVEGERVGRVGRVEVDVGGRVLRFEKGCVGRGVLLVDFEELCGRALSAVDYVRIYQDFEWVCIDKVPKLDVVTDRNEVTRFVRLVDTAYDHNVKLIVSAECPIHELFGKIDEQVVSEEAFAVARAISRLVEMQSNDFQKRPWKSHTAEAIFEPYGAAA